MEIKNKKIAQRGVFKIKKKTIFGNKFNLTPIPNLIVSKKLIYEQ